MSRTQSIRPEYVELMPKTLSEGVLYISRKYSTASHLCCCGCGTKIVTPLKPAGWKLQENGGCVSLYPSVGNWSAACQSHYWIRNGKIVWAGKFTQQEIALNRASDERALEDHYAPKTWQDKVEVFGRRVWKKISSWF